MSDKSIIVKKNSSGSNAAVSTSVGEAGKLIGVWSVCVCVREAAQGDSTALTSACSPLQWRVSFSPTVKGGYGREWDILLSRAHTTGVSGEYPVMKRGWFTTTISTDDFLSKHTHAHTQCEILKNNGTPHKTGFHYDPHAWWLHHLSWSLGKQLCGKNRRAKAKRVEETCMDEEPIAMIWSPQTVCALTRPKGEISATGLVSVHSSMIPDVLLLGRITNHWLSLADAITWLKLLKIKDVWK